jgi:hypothetical protein
MKLRGGFLLIVKESTLILGLIQPAIAYPVAPVNGELADS